MDGNHIEITVDIVVKALTRNHIINPFEVTFSDFEIDVSENIFTFRFFIEGKDSPKTSRVIVIFCIVDRLCNQCQGIIFRASNTSHIFDNGFSFCGLHENPSFVKELNGIFIFIAFAKVGTKGPKRKHEGYGVSFVVGNLCGVIFWELEVIDF